VTPEGERLHKFLSAILDSEPGRGVKMAEVGGKSFASEMLARVKAARAKMDELKLRGAAAVTGFQQETADAERGIKQIEDEIIELRQFNNDMLGNRPPADVETKTETKPADNPKPDGSS
jgi:hypothetical protein